MSHDRSGHDEADHRQVRRSITRPYVTLPYSQLDAFRALLDGNGFKYWVDEGVISIDDEPEMCWITLGRGVDPPAAVQKLLDERLTRCRMPLADELTSHRDRILAALDAAHDYYRNTRYAWRLVDHRVARGEKVNIRNPTTGNLTTEKNLPGKVTVYLFENLTVSTPAVRFAVRGFLVRAAAALGACTSPEHR